jgi:hypothetical protein
MDSGQRFALLGFPEGLAKSAVLGFPQVEHLFKTANQESGQWTVNN